MDTEGRFSCAGRRTVFRRPARKFWKGYEEMKANYFLGNQTFEVRETEIPRIGPTDVLVRVAACGVCGTDVHIYHGSKGSAEVTPPVVLGHEFSGVVVETGAAVTALRTGDHVTVDPNIYCGACPACRSGKKQLCEHLYAIGVNRDGGFAEYCAVPQAQCFLLPPELPLEYGAMTEPLACCLHGIDRAHIRGGDTVCVIGGGAIGLLMVQLAKHSGASRVVLSEPVEARRQVGRQLGADFTVDPLAQPLPEALRECLGEAGADVIIECVGNLAAVEQAFSAAKRGTTLLFFSVPRPEAFYSLHMMDIYQKELTILGSFINPDTHARAAALIAGGAIEIGPILTHRYPLEQLEDAIHMQMSNESLKVLVKP